MAAPSSQLPAWSPEQSEQQAQKQQAQLAGQEAGRSSSALPTKEGLELLGSLSLEALLADGGGEDHGSSGGDGGLSGSSPFSAPLLKTKLSKAHATQPSCFGEGDGWDGWYYESDDGEESVLCSQAGIARRDSGDESPPWRHSQQGSQQHGRDAKGKKDSETSEVEMDYWSLIDAAAAARGAATPRPPSPDPPLPSLQHDSPAGPSVDELPTAGEVSGAPSSSIALPDVLAFAFHELPKHLQDAFAPLPRSATGKTAHGQAPLKAHTSTPGDPPTGAASPPQVHGATSATRQHGAASSRPDTPSQPPEEAAKEGSSGRPGGSSSSDHAAGGSTPGEATGGSSAGEGAGGFSPGETLTRTGTAEQPLLNHPKYELYQALSAAAGVGASSSVHLARNRATGQAVAIKCIELRHVYESHGDVLAEVLHHRCLHHHNIARLIEVFLTSHHVAIVMEHANGGSLLDYQKLRGGRLIPHSARWFFQQLIIGVDSCHRMGVTYGDIKLENALLHTPAGVPLPLMKIRRSHRTTTHFSSLAYMAPEVRRVAGSGYDAALADIWSCGVVLHTMMFGTLPYGKEGCCVKVGRIPALPWGQGSLQVDPECGDLLRAIFTEPELRMSMADIKRHPWFTTDLPLDALEEVKSDLSLGDDGRGWQGEDKCQTEEEISNLLRTPALGGPLSQRSSTHQDGGGEANVTRALNSIRDLGFYLFHNVEVVARNESECDRLRGLVLDVHNLTRPLQQRAGQLDPKTAEDVDVGLAIERMLQDMGAALQSAEGSLIRGLEYKQKHAPEHSACADAICAGLTSALSRLRSELSTLPTAAVVDARQQVLPVEGGGYWFERNIDAYGQDLPGHGPSSSTPSSVRDLLDLARIAESLTNVKAFNSLGCIKTAVSQRSRVDWLQGPHCPTGMFVKDTNVPSGWLFLPQYDSPHQDVCHMGFTDAFSAAAFAAADASLVAFNSNGSFKSGLRSPLRSDFDDQPRFGVAGLYLRIPK